MATFLTILISLCLQHFTLGLRMYSIPVRRTVQISEFPHWDCKTQCLYYVDLFSEKATIFRYDSECDRVHWATIEGASYAASIIPINNCNNRFIVGCDQSLLEVYWNGICLIAKVVRAIFTLDVKSNIHINQVKADPTGRIYFGTYGDKLCGSKANQCLYFISNDNKVESLECSSKIHNGLAWDLKRKIMFFLDGCTYRIKAYDWDPDTGYICNRRTVYIFDVCGEPKFLPTGLTVDSCGHIWTTKYNSGLILKICPRTSQVIEKIKMPEPIVTTPVFGGRRMNEIFVGRTNLNNGTKANHQPPITIISGSLIQIVDLCSTGIPGIPVDKPELIC